MEFDLLTMDLTSILLAISVCAVLSLVIYFISAFGTKEKSFEEALEEQKKRSLEEEMQQKQEKGKKDKEKKFKKWSKRKEKNESQESEKVEIPVHDCQTNELVGEIEIVEPREIQPRRKGKATSKVSSSKSESSPSSEDVDIVEQLAKTSGDVKVVEKKKIEKPPMKEKDVTKMDGKDKDSSKSKVSEAQSIIPVTDEIVQVTPDVPSATPTKKKKKEMVDKATDFPGYTVSKLLQFLKGAELGDEDSQMMIDVLLNKQKDASEWKKKNDPLATVKKQLQEKEQAFEVELNQRQAATAKLKEIKQEYAQEKTRSSAQERMFQEKVNQQQQEIKSLTQRIKQLQEQFKGEKITFEEKIQQLQSTFDEKHEGIVKALQEEKAQLQKTVTKLESSARSKPATIDYETKFETVQKSKEELQKVHNLLVEQHTSLLSSHKAEVDKLNKQLSETQRMMSETDERQRSLVEEVEALKKSCENVENSKRALEQQLMTGGSDKRELENLQVQLEEAQGKSRNLETQFFHMSDRISELTQQNNSQVAQLQNLQQENERLSSELKSCTLTNDVQRTVHQNGDVNGKEKELLQKSIAEKEIILEEKEKQLQQINDELLKQESQVSILSSELEAQKQKNNELREKNWKTMEALSTAEKTAEQKVQEAQRTAEEKVLQVQQELEKQVKLVEEKVSSDKSSEELLQKVRKAEENLLSYQDEAEERLRGVQRESEEKVKHLNFELQRVENLHKSAESRVSEIEVTVEDLRSEVLKTQINTKKCLQRLFPDVAVDKSVPHDAWLLRFEEQALAVLKASSTNSSHVDELLAKISDVEQEKENLVKAVQHYKTVLADTESVLNRLQHSAELTESVWKDKLNVKEQELAVALKEKENLISEKEKLQSTIDQMGKLDEMQEKLKLLQGTIEISENERAHLQLKYEEVNNNYINLQDQIKSKEQKILELQTDLTSLEDTQKELEDIKSKLEKEKKINKDLSAQTVKLSSLVKIGQDSLKAEQGIVSQLKSQLEAQKSCTATANGTSSPSITVMENNEDSGFKK